MKKIEKKTRNKKKRKKKVHCTDADDDLDILDIPSPETELLKTDDNGQTPMVFEKDLFKVGIYAPLTSC